MGNFISVILGKVKPITTRNSSAFTEQTTPAGKVLVLKLSTYSWLSAMVTATSITHDAGRPAVCQF